MRKVALGVGWAVEPRLVKEAVATYSAVGDLVVEVGSEDRIFTAAAKAGRHVVAIAEDQDTARQLERNVEKLLPKTRRCLARVTVQASGQLPAGFVSRLRFVSLVAVPRQRLVGDRNILVALVSSALAPMKIRRCDEPGPCGHPIGCPCLVSWQNTSYLELLRGVREKPGTDFGLILLRASR